MENSVLSCGFPDSLRSRD